MPDADTARRGDPAPSWSRCARRCSGWPSPWQLRTAAATAGASSSSTTASLNRRVLASRAGARGPYGGAGRRRASRARLPSATGAFDVVLLDFVMPEMDGYATLGPSRPTKRLRHLPVIVISGVDELDSVVRCIEMGATDYLPKPFNGGRAPGAGRRLPGRQAAARPRARVPRAGGTRDRCGRGPRGGSVRRRHPRAGGGARRCARHAGAVVRAHGRPGARARGSPAREVAELRIEIDEAKQAQRVAEITGTDYFQELRGRASELRRMVDVDETT